jgi:mannan endo-1,4-beta-mannosidase
MKPSFQILLALLLFAACSPSEKPAPLIDANAQPQTVALHKNLWKLTGKHTLFGHQATLSYGYTWMNEPDRSDVKDVTGDFPALYAWDVADFTRLDETAEEAAQKQAQIANYVRQGYNRGGVITFCWHIQNPVNRTHAWDTTGAPVTAILPGGTHHDLFKTMLDTVAQFFTELAPIPIIFRPWHEHNGDWFWWGKGICTEQEYIDLWRFTVTYLRDEKNVHNLLWAFSPDRSRMELTENGYLYGYPGDDFVDILGYDNYWDVGHTANTKPADVKRAEFKTGLSLVGQIAAKKKKLAALTETGQEAVVDSLWYTKTLLAGLQHDAFSRRIVYVQAWRNANFEREKRDHFYVPYAGHKSAPDFLQFTKTEFVMLEKDLPKMYE